MIFVTFGTMDMPFERMAYAVDQFAATTNEEVIVQTGWTKYAFQHVTKSFQLCTKEEMAHYQKEASILIMQGGWGSICESMEMGKRMVVIPRYNGTEHIHDQFQLVRKLDIEKAVVGVFPKQENPTLYGKQYEETAELLIEAVNKARTFEFQKLEKGRAAQLIKAKIEELGCGKRICLASSAGGHLRELQLAIEDIPNCYNCYWLTLPITSTKAFLQNKEHVFLPNFQPAKKWTLFANAIPALFWVLIKRPTCIITTGAGVCIPTVGFARILLGTKIIFIDSAADVTHASRTPLWIKKYADLFLVQWKEMLQIFPEATCCGVL